MKEVEKTRVVRQQSARRAKKRKTNMSFYYIMVVALVMCVGMALSMTILFNIKDIQIHQDTQYSDGDIMTAGGVRKGDNLMRISTDKIKEKIMQNLVYIDDVEVKKNFPSTLIINITQSVPSANIQCDKGYLLVSDGGKILDVLEQPKVDLLVVKGFSPATTDINQNIQSEDEQKTKIYETLRAEIKNTGITKILAVDMTDKYDIKLNYDNRIQVRLGNSSDMNYKLRYAQKVLTENIGTSKEGYLIMRGTKEASFVTKEDMEAYESGIASAESAMETATTAVTDNNIISGSETGTMATDYTTAVTTPATTIDLDEFFQ